MTDAQTPEGRIELDAVDMAVGEVGAEPTEQPVDATGRGRLLLNAYGRACWQAGYAAATWPRCIQCGAGADMLTELCEACIDKHNQEAEELRNVR